MRRKNLLDFATPFLLAILGSYGSDGGRSDGDRVSDDVLRAVTEYDSLIRRRTQTAGK